MYLSTIMEDNLPAKDRASSGRGGLPGYHDFGQFRCIAVSLQSRGADRGRSEIRVRHASAADGLAIIEFLDREGRSRQFFPQYQVEDFGAAGGLLSHLQWEDVFLAFRGDDLIGMVAAWDQRAFRRWRVTGYVAWLGLLRIPFNRRGEVQADASSAETGFAAQLFHPLFGLCSGQRSLRLQGFIGGGHPRKRAALRFLSSWLTRAGFVAGGIAGAPQFPMPSRLYVVAWEEDAGAVQKLEPELVPYLELGSL